MIIDYHSASEQDTIRAGREIASVLRPGDVLALHGELGAGKTRFVRGVAVGLGISPAAVSSPTFVIAQEYHPPPPTACAAPRLVHIDAYRLRDADDLEAAGWDHLIQTEPGGVAPILAVEWAARVEPLLERFPSRASITLRHAAGTSSPDADAGARLIEFDIPDSWAQRPRFADLQSFVAARLAHDEPAPARCPITGKPVPADSPTFPFFDEQARLADLNRWFTGAYAVGRDLTIDDEDAR
ncbi:MAG: tRNA (adenosine(37)-N6)-threonylcarbamoyltransferase complex ATPase subunit type 1 TsaE [Phycisphaerales bacterium]